MKEELFPNRIALLINLDAKIIIPDLMSCNKT